MIDSYARILAMAALEAAESGGSGGEGKGIDNVYILNGHLHIVFSTGDDVDVGQVVGHDGADGKVYVPHIDEHKVLTWTIEDKEGEIPEPTDLNPFDEWGPIDEDGKSDYYWDDINS